ncbi:response regulator transcription factor [Nocardia asiatica]|uniref:response regulator transcription factor n=1 Tax=Nocardia asiatica TaxID=209252 RepID=UPI002456B2FC|nr:LuxR C-terminal-related transcriptional regulator [Nocardia asiatica]
MTSDSSDADRRLFQELDGYLADNDPAYRFDVDAGLTRLRNAVEGGALDALDPVEAPPSTVDPIRIGVLDEYHEIWAAELDARLREYPDIRIAASAATVSELLSATADLDVVLLCLPPNLRGTSPTGSIRALYAAGVSNILVMTVPSVERGLVQAVMRTGVLSIITSVTPLVEIVAAIRAAVRGEIVAAMDWAAALDSEAELIPRLTAREQEILSLYASGMTARDVAVRLGMSRETIYSHLNAIRRKYATPQTGVPAHTIDFRAQGHAPGTWWGRPKG